MATKGMPELAKFLSEFPPKFQKNTCRRALRKGANVVKGVARQNIHNISGELAKGLKVSTRSRGTKVTATLKATGPHAGAAVWLEYGTKGHFITAKNGKALSFGGMSYRRVWNRGIAPYGIKGPGGPHAFLRPALDASPGAVLVAVGESIKSDLATKGGIDVADIEIGGA